MGEDRDSAERGERKKIIEQSSKGEIIGPHQFHTFHSVQRRYDKNPTAWAKMSLSYRGVK